MAVLVTWNRRTAGGSQKVWRSSAPFDLNSLPASPLATLTDGESSFLDETAGAGQAYFYGIETIVSSVSVLSELIFVTTAEGDGDGGSDMVAAGTYALTLTNSGFETGDLTGWTSDNGNYFVDDGSAYSDGRNAARTGTWMALPGVTAFDRLRQTVSLSQYAANIDAGGATVSLSAWSSTIQFDAARIGLAFLDASDTQIGSETTTAYSSLFTWNERTLSVAVPANARSVQLLLDGIRGGAGSVAQCYYDDVSASIVIA